MYGQQSDTGIWRSQQRADLRPARNSPIARCSANITQDMSTVTM
jgi:hypothetical protein